MMRTMIVLFVLISLGGALGGCAVLHPAAPNWYTRYEQQRS
jgi:hypothetical protein